MIALIARSDVELRLREVGEDSAGAAAGERRQRHHRSDRPGSENHRRIARRYLAFVAACMPTANGSTIAPSAKLTLSGSLKV